MGKENQHCRIGQVGQVWDQNGRGEKTNCFQLDSVKEVRRVRSSPQVRAELHIGMNQSLAELAFFMYITGAFNIRKESFSVFSIDMLSSVVYKGWNKNMVCVCKYVRYESKKTCKYSSLRNRSYQEGTARFIATCCDLTY